MAIKSPHEELMTAALNKRMPSMKAMKALFTDPPLPMTPPPPMQSTRVCLTFAVCVPEAKQPCVGITMES